MKKKQEEIYSHDFMDIYTEGYKMRRQKCR